MEKHYIGFKNGHVINSKNTEKQILAIKEYKLNICDNDGNKLCWDDLDNLKYNESLFRNIVKDRKIRVDRKKDMADRPPYCVIYTYGDEAIRVEYYEGHDELVQIYDLRRNDLYDKALGNDIEEDICKYSISPKFDSTKFLGDKTSDIIHDCLNETHLCAIERTESLNMKYYGRCSETLEQHRKDLIGLFIQYLKVRRISDKDWNMKME